MTRLLAFLRELYAQIQWNNRRAVGKRRVAKSKGHVKHRNYK